MTAPASLTRDISPPPTRRTSRAEGQTQERAPQHQLASPAQTQSGELTQHLATEPSLAAIEAGQVQISGHLEYFVRRFSAVRRPSAQPLMTLTDFRDLYERNQHNCGTHFVIHQHDHPISGVHYDLRLQFSDTSALSFAVPYGLPGNPNSVRPNRMAIETRVHNLWNNLMESASHSTGSLLIWDTGEYEILDRPRKKARMTDDELSDAAENDREDAASSNSERLVTAFQHRYILLRLNGRRLPRNYTIALRLPSRNNLKPRTRKPKTKRRKLSPGKAAELAEAKAAATSSDTDTDPVEDGEAETASASPADIDAIVASEDEIEQEDITIRAHNAYPGATNTIGSIHQRHWYLTIDRRNSGFHKAQSGPDQGRWIGGWGEPFYVRGRDYERSVVSGRTADEVMEDEGVEKFAGRKMWRPILD